MTRFSIIEDRGVYLYAMTAPNISIILRADLLEVAVLVAPSSQ